jgi:eukaryotic-like serine/threonine-protein kinase
MEDSDRTLGSDRTFGGPNESPTIAPTEEAPTLPPGTILAGRYHIVDLLGVGGMGAVYKAFDRQLTRLVALKTILPEMAGTPTALKRFKQEVLLAQSIVHKNVVRIFDIGEDGGTKFITMDFIEGVDLKNLIKEKGKLPPAEAAGILRQVCQGLEAAHAAGVVHRDLKPQNIMIEKDGHIVVMDFGIARSGESRGATQTGAFLGTPEYMSPEQAQTENVDARSDIFSLGLIFYELLTGKLPFHGKTVLETMFKRTTERAIPPAEIDATVPKGANDIVNKCLQMKREERYQSVTELLEDLENFDPTKKVGAAERAKARLKKAARYRNWAVAAALVILTAAVVGLVFRNRSSAPASTTAHALVTVVLADFTNHTGDPLLDGALEPAVKMELEGAGFITAYDRPAVVRTLGVRVPAKLDELAARQIAVNQGLGVVLSGSLDRQGEGYTLSIKATQAVTGNVIKIAEETASKKDQILFATTKLTAAVRRALGDDTSDSALRFAMETITATSLEAIHEYAAGMEALSNGKHQDALQSFSKAVDIDRNFGLGYGGMAIAARNLGQQEEAVKHIQSALGRLDRMTDREKYRIRALHFNITGDQEKCVEEYTTLVTKFPSDAGGFNNIAACLVQLRNIPKALEQMRQAAAILPKRTLYRFNISVDLSYSGDFQAGEREARALQTMDPTYPTGPVALAFAQLGQGQVSQAAETYPKLNGFGKIYESRGRSGLADLALYEGRFAEAVQILEQGAAEDLSNKYSDIAATKLAILAHTRLSQSNTKAAVSAAEDALSNSKSVKVRFLAGRTLAAAGQTARAQKVAAELSKEFLNEPQAYGKLIEGEILLAKGDPRAAVKPFTEANSLLDTWIGRFDLGRAYFEAGALPQADSEFEQCLKRRGEALALFLDEWPTYGYLPPLYYYLGRVREAEKSEGYAEFYRNYISIRDKATEDRLLADARKRAGL